VALALDWRPVKEGALKGLALRKSDRCDAGCDKQSRPPSSSRPPATVGGAAVHRTDVSRAGTARPSFDSEIKFEVWLPPTAADWTGRMKVNGTGGYAGATPYARLAQDITDGFVTGGQQHGATTAVSRRTGRSVIRRGSKTGGLRAHYFVATRAKTLSRAFYDKSGQPFVLRRLLERWPPGDDDGAELSELFDGIVAGAPSQWYPDLLMWLCGPARR
jgi:hypothetical protein